MGTSAANTAAKNIIVVIDLHSRFVWAKAVKRITKEATVSFLCQLFDDVGKALLSDNGVNFTSTLFRNFLEGGGVRPLLTPPYRSQANGVCERANGTIVSALRREVAAHPNKRWSSHLRDVVRVINDTPHTSTGFTPRF